MINKLNKLKIYRIIYISIILPVNLELYAAAEMESENSSPLDSHLISAVGSGDKEQVIRLIESGANVDASICGYIDGCRGDIVGRDENKRHQRTAMLLAIIKGDAELVKLLINAKANINSSTQFFETNDMKSRERQYYESRRGTPGLPYAIARTLNHRFRHAGASPSSTFLIVATRNRLINIVKLLLKAGAELNINDSSSEKAIGYANVNTNLTYGEEDKKELMEIYKLLQDEPARRVAALRKYIDNMDNIINESNCKPLIKPILNIILQYAFGDFGNISRYETIPLIYRLES